MKKLIEKARYRHYKGKEYTLLHIACDSETLEDLVVYQAEYGEKEIWVRPAKMFLELVNGVPRFQLLEIESAVRWILNAVEAEELKGVNWGQELLDKAEILARHYEATKDK